MSIQSVFFYQFKRKAILARSYSMRERVFVHLSGHCCRPCVFLVPLSHLPNSIRENKIKFRFICSQKKDNTEFCCRNVTQWLLLLPPTCCLLSCAKEDVEEKESSTGEFQLSAVEGSRHSAIHAKKKKDKGKKK